MSLTRREFLAKGGVALVAASSSVPRVLARTAAALTDDPDGRILVMLQLTGGNDGLNTVIPLESEAYRQLRPTLAVRPGQAHKLRDDVGLAPRLGELKELYDEGWLAVVQGVGYPNPNRSHFQSMDIWHTADPELRDLHTGWLGRVLETDAECSALHLDDEALPLALRAAGADVPSVRTIESFRLHGGAGAAARAAVDAVLDARGGAGTGVSPASAAELDFVRRTAVSACRNARRLEALPPDRAADYPGYALARRLHDIARLICADFGPRIYYTSLGGFDTHARQQQLHPELLGQLAQSVRAFFRDLKQHGLADRVLVLTFSEFGRRAAENNSLGTDHGAAAPLFAIGPGVRAGVHGPTPDLRKLVDGDVPHAVDFRGVYAAVLEKWLGVASKPILRGAFEPVAIFG